MTDQDNSPLADMAGEPMAANDPNFGAALSAINNVIDKQDEFENPGLALAFATSLHFTAITTALKRAMKEKSP